MTTKSAATTNKIQLEKRPLAVTMRAYMKKTGSVKLRVRNDAGEYNLVTLNRNKHHSCVRVEDGSPCPGFQFAGHCYHVDYCRDIENARAAKKRAEARAALDAVTEQVRGNLSSNAGFSLLRQ